MQDAVVTATQRATKKSDDEAMRVTSDATTDRRGGAGGSSAAHLGSSCEFRLSRLRDNFSRIHSTLPSCRGYRLAVHGHTSGSDHIPLTAIPRNRARGVHSYFTVYTYRGGHKRHGRALRSIVSAVHADSCACARESAPSESRLPASANAFRCTSVSSSSLSVHAQSFHPCHGLRLRL